jgi:hypothetical protein
MTGSEIIPIVQELIVKIDPAIPKAGITFIAKVAEETSIKLLGKSGEKLVDGAGNLTKAAQDLLIPISRKYIEKYTDRHGTLKVLDMNKPVSLDSVYTKVNFQADIIHSYQSLEDQEKLYRQREKTDDKEKRPGFDVANEQKYLMVLGKPGTGKTTFLQTVGLEALKGKRNGKYQHTCIPVLLELRRFRSKEKIDLVQAITSEFQNCGLPEYQKCTEELLKKGRLLILLDGLDEVPNEQMREMKTQIRDLVDRYADNRFIASCRIADHHKSDNFKRFTDVTIADFDDEQIETFIGKWFESHSQPEWGEQCWQKLNSGEHNATKELTKTPLLLTFLCILFQNTGQFPTNRSALYKQTLRVLLQKWDARKEIDRPTPYKKMTPKRKKNMLAQVAHSNFVDNRLFFSGKTVSKQIEKALKKKSIDVHDVLMDIQLQHGIIVERQEDIYSFAHLTLQEYLTALHIVENKLDIEELVSKYLCDRRWREVFLILAGLIKADDLLLKMEKAINSLDVNSKLRDLLVWAEQVTNISEGDTKPVAKRAIALVNANADTLNLGNDIANAYNLEDLVTSLANFKLNFHYDADLDGIEFGLDKFIEYVQLSKELQIYKNIDYAELIAILQKLKEKLLNVEGLMETREYLIHIVIQTWLEFFSIKREMIDLSESEGEALENYLYANLLMVECKNAAVESSPKDWEETYKKTWDDIESRMLLPKA